MSDVLQNQVVVLNKAWQAIDQKTVEAAISQMASDAATALEISGEDNIRPVSWAEWITLPIRDGDLAIHTSKRAIRVPTVIVAMNFGGFPVRRPKMNLREVARRDGGVCQYTNQKLRPSDMSLDHVVPKSRGGSAKSWNNVVLAHKKVNNKKGNQLNSEAGLRLIRAPFTPKPSTPVDRIRPTHPDHFLFVGKALDYSLEEV